MGATYATAADVVALLGRELDQYDTYTVRQQLEVASAKLRLRVPDVDARLAANQIDPVLLRDAVAKAVHRFMRNRLGIKSQTYGPSSATYGDEGQLVIADEDIVGLVPVASTAGTIRLGARSGAPGGPMPSEGQAAVGWWRP